MKHPRTQLTVALGIMTAFGAIVLGVAASSGGGSPRAVSFYPGGHTFGLGEQQVYLIDRESVLIVRHRDAEGDVRSKVYHYHVRSSVAWTIEGLSSDSAPVLGVATAAPTPSASPSSYAPSPANEAQPQSPAPSPMLDARGTGKIVAGTALDELTPTSIILSSIGSELPDIGKPWKSLGEIPLPFGRIAISLDNAIRVPTGNQDANLAEIESTGTSAFQATVRVAGFGVTTLRGGGAATGSSFLETQHRLLLGTSIAAQSHGNASATGQRGSYDLSVKVAIKLVKYVPGIPIFRGSPGFVPASGYLGSTAAPDTAIYSTAAPNNVAIPAATDTGFIGPPAVATPYRSALPAMSLPPIPIVMASDQPAASPPAGPTPTPQPTHY